EDVLARFLDTVKLWPTRHVVRLTADCPFHDPGVLDALVDLHLRGDYDYSSNLHPPTYPHGLDAEVVRREVLEMADRESTAPSHREHVTLFLREHADRFRCGNLTFGNDVSAYRLTLDRPEDYRFLQAFMTRVADLDSIPSIYEIVRLLELFPELVTINGSLERYEWKKTIREREARDVNIGRTS
ncbi:MAG TPA: spore coat protein, partial [Candidatus Ozemobacteraceae bacterium]|nr:spore coat protein [Candidatus Ozemobacteraceae bacterium]